MRARFVLWKFPSISAPAGHPRRRAGFIEVQRTCSPRVRFRSGFGVCSHPGFAAGRFAFDLLRKNGFSAASNSPLSLLGRRLFLASAAGAAVSRFLRPIQTVFFWKRC